MSNKIRFHVEDTVCIKSTPMPEFGEYTYKDEIVISRDAFIECYNKWIKGEADKGEEK